MKTVPVLVVLGYVLVMFACAWAAFRCGAPVIGTLAIIGTAYAVWSAIRLAGKSDNEDDET